MYIHRHRHQGVYTQCEYTVYTHCVHTHPCNAPRDVGMLCIIHRHCHQGVYTHCVYTVYTHCVYTVYTQVLYIHIVYIHLCNAPRDVGILCLGLTILGLRSKVVG